MDQVSRLGVNLGLSPGLVRRTHSNVAQLDSLPHLDGRLWGRVIVQTIRKIPYKRKLGEADRTRPTEAEI
jgi:hypothetical protein